jgi:fatty-acyl-CoA synthase
MIPSPAERRTQLERRYPDWPRRTLGQHFAAVCEEFADRPMLMTPEGIYTYSEVWRRALAAAKGLMALGVKRRQHVALLMANSVEFLALKLAIALVGAVCVPVNTMLRENELAYILGQSDSQWLFLHQLAGGNRHDQSLTRILAAPAEAGPPLKLQGLVCLANTTDPLASESRFLPWTEFLRRGEAVSDSELMTCITSGQYPDEVCDIIYTSGTTGQPKGVMLRHDMILRCAYSTALSRAYEDGRRIFTPLPMYHVFAYIEAFMSVTFVGGAFISAPTFSPRLSLQLMERYRASDFHCVPSMLISILNHPERDAYDLSSLFALLCAAAPAPVPLWEQAVRELKVTEICTAYGGTEATASTVHTEIGDPPSVIATRVGRIKPGGCSGLPEFGGVNTQYKVVDPFTGEDLPPGSVGELVVRGNFVTRGYYNKPMETAAVIDKDGWLRTGDLGRIDERGYLEFLGRSKEMYKVSGENVSPKEIEDVISLHPAVKQVYVVGVEHPLTGETGAAFIELRDCHSLTRREVVAWCNERLAKFKVPHYVWFVKADEWPMTSTGKIQKFRLKELARERLLTSPAGEPEV